MVRYKLSKEWIRKNAKFVKNAYTLALKKKYDIKSQSEVLAIIKITDPANANEENAQTFSKILQLFANELGIQMKERYQMRHENKQKVVN